MKYLILLLISTVCFAQKSVMQPRIRIFKQWNGPKKSRPQNRTSDQSREQAILKRILANNKRVNELLKFKKSEPMVIWDGNKIILTGKTFRGVLLNSIVSTNLSSPVLVRADGEQGLPVGTKFSCFGVTKNRRVLTLCNKMVTKEREVEVSAQILNVDGTAGLLGNYDDGKEDLIAGAVISDFSKGVLSASSDHVDSALGAYPKANLKNQILSGLISSAKTTSEILLDESRQKEPIVTVNAGKKVLIYFMEGLSGY